MQDFRKLIVWQKAHDLSLAVYRASQKLPSVERFALTDQLRRAAVSIGANVAEGCGRSSRPDFARFVVMAAGSASELEYLLLVARDLGYLEVERHKRLEEGVQEVKRMLAALLRRLKSQDSTRRTATND